jgi:hypothetical protein
MVYLQRLAQEAYQTSRNKHPVSANSSYGITRDLCFQGGLSLGGTVQTVAQFPTLDTREYGEPHRLSHPCPAWLCIHAMLQGWVPLQGCSCPSVALTPPQHQRVIPYSSISPPPGQAGCWLPSMHKQRLHPHHRVPAASESMHPSSSFREDHGGPDSRTAPGSLLMGP